MCTNHLCFCTRGSTPDCFKNTLIKRLTCLFVLAEGFQHLGSYPLPGYGLLPSGMKQPLHLRRTVRRPCRAWVANKTASLLFFLCSEASSALRRYSIPWRQVMNFTNHDIESCWSRLNAATKRPECLSREVGPQTAHNFFRWYWRIKGIDVYWPTLPSPVLGLSEASEI